MISSHAIASMLDGALYYQRHHHREYEQQPQASEKKKASDADHLARIYIFEANDTETEYSNDAFLLMIRTRRASKQSILKIYIIKICTASSKKSWRIRIGSHCFYAPSCSIFEISIFIQQINRTSSPA